MLNKSFYQTQSGVALLLTILLMSLILSLSIYVLSFSLTEDRIARSQTWGEKTYYLAEAGIQEMVWKLKNDAAYKQSFETNPSWTASFTRDDPFGAASGSYTVAIANSSLAHGQITSTATIDISAGKTSKRIVKTYVYKALGQTGIEDSAGYADGNIDISTSRVNFYNGSAHSNSNFILNNGSIIFVNSDLKAVGNYFESWTSTSTIEGQIYAANYPPAASIIDMPAVDFDSSATSSYKNQAAVVYDEDDFEDILENNKNVSLAGPITYVEGDVEISGAQNLTINGLLVVEEELEIGDNSCWKSDCSVGSITINHATGSPSGILAKDKIYFKSYTGNVNIAGVVYATDQLNILNLAATGPVFNITGGLVSRKLTISSSWRQINITHDNDILLDVFPPTEFSPVITVEHWEEEY